jgi:serine/threonine-protein kinase
MEPGQTLLHYRLAEKLGEGGMGVVFRAQDTTLDRDVAIKVLPQAFTSDAERLSRFEREAKVLASLNHPNVAAIYGLHQSGGVRFLAMELVPGEDLAQRLSRGRLEVQEALVVGLGIASALEYAHDHGIVHRDLKPANVKVSPEGAVKVLDFGLAKALDPASSGVPPADPALSPTITIAGTQVGLILGTAAYMSPEQAAGRPVDRRADIWAFGVVLFEMLAGRQLFAGETVSHVLASVLKDTPDWAALPRDLAPRLRDLLERCLRKDRQKRLQSVGDARVLLEEILADPRAGASSATATGDAASMGEARAGATARGARQALPWLVAGAFAAALLAVSLWPGRGRPDEARGRVARFSIALPTGYRAATEDFPCVAITQDGRRLAIVGADAQGTRRLVVRDLDRIEPLVLQDTENAQSPFFSPDGEWVGFFAGGVLKKIAVAGGRAIQLATVTGNNRGATWGADGSIYLADGTQGGILKLAADGKTAPLTQPDTQRNERTHRWPHALPGGKAMLFTADTFETTEFYDDATITVVDVATGARHPLAEQSSLASCLPGGHLIFARGGSLFTAPIDPVALRATGTPTLVLQGVATDVASGAVHFAVSESGALFYLPGDLAGGGRRDLLWLSPDGKSESAGIVTGHHEMMSLSPDGTRAALLSSGGEAGELWIWIADLRRGTMSRLTFEGYSEEPVWSADGQRVAYAVTKMGQSVRAAEVYWKPADGSAEPELLVSLDTRAVPMSFSPDGRFLAFERMSPAGSSDIWILPLQGDRKPRPFLETPPDESMARFSPDSRWLAYVSSESGPSEVYVRPFPGPGGRWQISTSGGVEPRWSPTGKEIFYRDEGKLFKVPVDGSKAAFVAGRPERFLDGMPTGGNPHTYDLAPDGRRVLALIYTQNTAGNGEPTLVLNWASEVERLTSPSK